MASEELPKNIKGNRPQVTVMMPVSSVGYVNRLKALAPGLDAKRYGPRNRKRRRSQIDHLHSLAGGLTAMGNSI